MGSSRTMEAEVLAGLVHVPRRFTLQQASPSSHQLHIQTDVIPPSELTMAIEATSRLGPLVSSEEIVLTVTLYNPTSAPITLPDLGGCLLQFSVNDATSLSSECLPTFTQIEAYEANAHRAATASRRCFRGRLRTALQSLFQANALSASLNLDIALPADGFHSRMAGPT